MLPIDCQLFGDIPKEPFSPDLKNNDLILLLSQEK